MLYKDFAPTQFDSRIALPSQEDWLVAPAGQTRDSGPLERSNFGTILEALGGESETVEVHRFGHWGPGWFEIILVDPSRQSEVEAWEKRLDDYPVADEEHYSMLEHEDAQEVWSTCYDQHERVDYIRENPNQFDFYDLREMVACICGVVFCGYASELLG